MLRRGRTARARARAVGPGRALIEGDVAHLPFREGSFERPVAPTTSRMLGFHAHFDVSPLLREVGLEVGETERLPPFGYWRALRVVEAG